MGAYVQERNPLELNRWLPLVKWLLVIPHLLVLMVLGIGLSFVLIWAFFATKQIPRDLFELMVPGSRRRSRGPRNVSYVTSAGSRSAPGVRGDGRSMSC